MAKRPFAAKGAFVAEKERRAQSRLVAERPPQADRAVAKNFRRACSTPARSREPPSSLQRPHYPQLDPALFPVHRTPLTNSLRFP